jgi:hypothetical protein
VVESVVRSKFRRHSLVTDQEEAPSVNGSKHCPAFYSVSRTSAKRSENTITVLSDVAMSSAYF